MFPEQLGAYERLTDMVALMAGLRCAGVCRTGQAVGKLAPPTAGGEHLARDTRNSVSVPISVLRNGTKWSACPSSSRIMAISHSLRGLHVCSLQIGPAQVGIAHVGLTKNCAT